MHITWFFLAFGAMHSAVAGVLPIEVFPAQARAGAATTVAFVSGNGLALINEETRLPQGKLSRLYSRIAVWDISVSPNRLVKLAGDEGEGRSINSKGTVAGRSLARVDWRGKGDAAVWEGTTARLLRTDIPSAPASWKYVESAASAINDAGVIVGWIAYLDASDASDASDAEVKRPVVWCGSSSAPRELPPADPRFPWGQATSINDSGLVAGVGSGAQGGMFPVSWQVGGKCPEVSRARSLGAKWGMASRVSNDGRIAGFVGVSSREMRAATWRDGSAELTPADPQTAASVAGDVNAAGILVGKFLQSPRDIGVIWCPARRKGEPPVRIEPIKPEGWTAVTEMVSVTSQGWVLGNGLDGNGRRKAFVLKQDPCPRP